MRHTWKILGVTAVLMCQFPVLAGDWTGWLGPTRNGRVTGVQLPQPWPERPRTVWAVNVGTGYGTPLVVGDRVFQHARAGEDEVLLCVDLSTGEVIWKKSVSVPFRVRGGGEFHGKGPKACPVYADGRVFILTITGDLIAWSADDGRLLWRSDYGRRYQQNHPHWGASCSPVVHEGRVIVHFGNDDRGELAALDAETGAEIWTSGSAGASYSSPLVTEIEGVQQVVEWNHLELVGVELETGEKLWSTPFAHQEHNQNMPTPTLHQGRILLGAENRGLHCFHPQLANGRWTVQKVWSQDRVGLDMSSAVICNDLLFGLSHFGRGRLFCVNPDNGQILWQGEGRYGANATFLTVSDFVVALNDTGRLQVIRASGNGLQEAGRWTVSDRPTWAPPVVLPDGLLIKDQNRLMKLSF
ncbi:MAG: PQQ-binding-like beta-propeller repeat protein [Planctomycetaceae bacterium]|nr:PQQ-binding-like beta-propeller repeat protein [Planctomycetaceae bacterium]